MPTNPDTNQTPKTIQNDGTDGVKNPPSPAEPDKHVPPVEVPGRETVPEHVPEKAM